jgi:hypothetical protein
MSKFSRTVVAALTGAAAAAALSSCGMLGTSTPAPVQQQVTPVTTSRLPSGSAGVTDIQAAKKALAAARAAAAR